MKIGKDLGNTWSIKGQERWESNSEKAKLGQQKLELNMHR